GFGLFQISTIIDIDMTDAVQVLDNGYPGITTDAFDQSLASPRHYHVNVLGHADQCTYRGAVGGFHHLHHLLRQTGGFQSLAQTFGNGTVGLDGFGTATQDAGVAGLQAQAGRLDRYVRPGLVDDADHPQGHTHAADLNTGRQILHVANGADRVGQRSHLAQAFNHVLQPRGDNGQTI